MSEQEQALLEAADLLEREADLIDDWQEERIEKVKAKAKLLRGIAAQVAALTEQRDALLAACKAAEELPDLQHAIDNCGDEGYRLGVMRNRDAILAQLAAAIAQREPKE